MSTVAIIPVRGGSKGIPRKNLQDLWGQPLFTHVLEAAQKAELVDEVYVLTDDEEIAYAARSAGGEVMARHSHTCTDEASTESVMHDFFYYRYPDYKQIDKFVLLQATSPLTTAEDIDGAIKAMYTISRDNNTQTSLKTSYWDSVLSVCKDHGGPLCGGFRWSSNKRLLDEGIWPLDYMLGQNRPRRQDMPDIYRENGAIYVTTANAFIKSGNRVSGRVNAYVMPRQRSFEVDDIEDLEELRNHRK